MLWNLRSQLILSIEHWKEFLSKSSLIYLPIVGKIQENQELKLRDLLCVKKRIAV